ncbi:MAG: DnaD domain protein [Bacillota bacterium]
MTYENNIKFGWIKLYRSVQDHWLWNNEKEFDERSAWIDLLLMVNYQDKKFQMGNELVNVKRGERITSQRKLAERWKWSRTKVRKFLELLERDGMIELERTSKRTRVKACNFDLYQGWETRKKPSHDPHITQIEPTLNPREAINNKANKALEGNKENNSSGGGDGGRSAGSSDLIYIKFLELIGKPLTETQYKVIEGYLDNGFEEEVIVLAFEEANFHDVKTVAYIRGILNRWESLGIKTIKDAKEDIKQHEKENIAKIKSRKGNKSADGNSIRGNTDSDKRGKKQGSCEYERFFNK